MVYDRSVEERVQDPHDQSKAPSENIPPYKEQGFGARVRVNARAAAKDGSMYSTATLLRLFIVCSGAAAIPLLAVVLFWCRFMSKVTQVCRLTMSQKRVNTSKKPTYSSNVSDIENKNDAEHNRTSFFVLGLHCG